ncbi:MAG: hypothetical protein GY864_13020 [Desulfobacterales bacterium]|nr:hypothetical protein [Desulfobacterales bacterium]
MPNTYSDKGVAVVNADGRNEIIPADTVITTLPLLPDTEFLTQLKGSFRPKGLTTQ